MVKVKVKVGNIVKFLDAWDKENFDLYLKLKKINSKQRKEQLNLRKKNINIIRVHK